MRFFWSKKPKRTAGSDRPLRQIWDRDPEAAGRDAATGIPRDLLTPSGIPDSLQPKLDPEKTRVFDDEL
jgi:hypothetical protein